MMYIFFTMENLTFCKGRNDYTDYQFYMIGKLAARMQSWRIKGAPANYWHAL